MTRLMLRYSIRKQSLEDLYDIIDQDGLYYGEPAPHDQALKDMRERQARLDAEALEDFAVASMMSGGFV